MDANQVSYIVALLFSVAILVILIVILAKYKGEAGPTYDQEAANSANTKVNWLYYLSIAEVGIIVVFGLLGLLAMRRYCMLGSCTKA
jgi:nitric oxide reductase large subunit